MEMEQIQPEAKAKAKVVWFNEYQDLGEAIVSGLQLALISEDNHQCMPFVRCKDFLQDAVHGTIIQRTADHSGFTYDPKKHKPVCLKKMRLLAANSQDPSLRDKIPSCLDFINQFEKELGIVKTKTTAVECDEPKQRYKAGGVWLLEANQRWIRSPTMVSLYSLLVRVGFTHTLGKSYKETIAAIVEGKLQAYQPADQYRLQNAKKGIDRILKYGDRTIFHKQMKKNYPAGISVYSMHNHMGIQGFSENLTQPYMPYWHRSIKE
jgi:hypothetical protein